MIIDPAALTVGTRFDTEFESGCVVTVAPGYDSCVPENFAALDSDGVECGFFLPMVKRIHSATETDKMAGEVRDEPAVDSA